MNEAVVIEHAAAETPLGDLGQTVSSLNRGDCALRPGPLFEVPSAYAPFANEQFRDIPFAVSALASRLPRVIKSLPSHIFINCSAKGDIRSLENIVCGRTSDVAMSPLLDLQAQAAIDTIGLAPRRVMSISNACASGGIAVEVAKDLLEQRRCTTVVLFGLDSISRFIATGFHALSALSPSGARPFDARRDGLSLGEAAVMAVLTFRIPQPSDIIVAGAGSSNDANHRTGPSRTGDGLYRAAEAALSDARMKPSDIGAVKCHGTATQYNDAMEAKAIERLFGAPSPPCASFKGAIGHTSGAGSLVEILIAARCISNRSLPPTVRYEKHGVDERISVSSTAQSISRPSVLCLSAGFGGVNVAVVIKEAGK